jgi:hypothetical protein
VIFYSLFEIVSEKIQGMIQIIVPYQISRYKTMKLVVESQPIFSSDCYDPYLTSILESDNPILADKRTHF